MNLLNERPLVTGLVIGLVIGILVGWLGLGWGIWPVEWTDASPAMLRDDFRADYVKMSADQYVRSRDVNEAKNRMMDWREGAPEYTCALANEAPAGTVARMNLLELAQVLQPGVSCDNITAAAPAEEPGQSLAGRLGILCGALLLALALAGGTFYLVYLRGARKEVTGELPTDEPTASLSAASGRTIPLAQFPTEYTIGHDTYDDSFSIETATGEFLGECGLGISETIGAGDPKKVTAFEVWLFDKNDIRTITKVIMSDHAYHDDALRAKLAPKGEAGLAKPGETVVLETASLIVNARIVEMEYGTGELPPQSHFNRLVVELAAWAKEGEEAAEGDLTRSSEDESSL
ncbi:MAG: hypothetical protein GQ526_02355 [Ardenticatenales bacterium]|nr:hypothetical protein [Ardenticatenales bacterium]